MGRMMMRKMMRRKMMGRMMVRKMMRRMMIGRMMVRKIMRRMMMRRMMRTTWGTGVMIGSDTISDRHRSLR